MDMGVKKGNKCASNVVKKSAKAVSSGEKAAVKVLKKKSMFKVK